MMTKISKILFELLFVETQNENPTCESMFQLEIHLV